MKLIVTTFAVLLLNAISIFSQFDIEAYKEYLKTHQDMTVDELLQEYPAGLFKSKAPTNFSEAEYSGRVDSVLKLTNYEKDLINNHGFMVTERLKLNNFQNAFKEIYYKDMPVYISSDAILHALHYSFDNILKSIELNLFIDKLDNVLSLIYNKVQVLAAKSDNAEYLQAVNDLDVYITVSRQLLAGENGIALIKPIFAQNTEKINEIQSLIKSKASADIELFSTTVRPYDFSQFEPRGHYTYPEELTAYFQAMIWLGRTEIYITAPLHQDPYYKQKESDIKRQNILASLLSEAVVLSGADTKITDLEKILEVLLGRQDNITVFEGYNVLKNLGAKDAKWVSEDSNWKIYQTELLKLNSANQLYNSQILYSDPLMNEQVDPPASLMLIGQRAILDGFVTANVVYDRIMYHGNKVTRMLPSTLDILFALGNDAAIQLLEPELRTFPYSTNLAALRYLINSYDEDFWKSTSYLNWLSAIKGLNPPLNRDGLPLFMQTAAWWQKSMNTQLASWSQLRHDFLLYAKQPYSSGIPQCSYPDCFVEPVPEVYNSIETFCRNLSGFVSLSNYEAQNVIESFIKVCTKLTDIAEKELKDKPLDKDDIYFVNTLIHEVPNCVTTWGGWYLDLLYGIEKTSYDGYVSYPCNYTVADVHTAPTDDEGNEKGWVLHGGTGMVNMAVIVTNGQNGKPCTFVGPVMSYYETVTENYKRLTDNEWASYHKGENSHRPVFTNLYLADENGGERPNQVSLLVSVDDEPSILKK